MANCKQHYIGKHLKSARQWLARAERAFGKDRDVRGELDLFLAQAELQHAREINRAEHSRYKYSLCRQGGAVLMALVMFFAGWGGYHLWDGLTAAKIDVESRNTTPPPEQTLPILAGSSAAPPAVLQIADKISTAIAPSAAIEPVPEPLLPAAERISEPEPVIPNLPNKVPVADESVSAKPQEVRLSPEEMQKLVRTAGKSLRGQ